MSPLMGLLQSGNSLQQMRLTRQNDNCYTFDTHFPHSFKDVSFTCHMITVLYWCYYLYNNIISSVNCSQLPGACRYITCSTTLSALIAVNCLARVVILNDYIEDIYSFSVNTINIVIEWNENISIFTSSKHEWNLNVFITRDENFYGIHWKRVNFLFILLFTRQCAFLTS